MGEYDFGVERRAFARLHPTLAAQHLGMYVVIVGERVVAVTGTYDEAVDAGFDAAGGPKFLAKKVERRIEPQSLPLCLLIV